MRRCIGIMLIVLMLGGCVSSDTQPGKIDIEGIHFDTSEQGVSYEEIMSDGYFSIEGDTAYFNPHFSPWICYWDLKSGEAGKLCGKPECEHEGRGCNAYTTFQSGTQVYEDHVYFMEGNSVMCRMDLDGTDREIVRTVDTLKDSGWGWIIHRGKIYTKMLKQVVEAGKRYEDLYIYQYDLEGTEKGRLLLQERYESFPQVLWRFRGDYAYFQTEYGTLEETEREVYIYDMKTGAVEKVIDLHLEEWITLDFHVHEQDLVYLEKTVTDLRLSHYDLLTGEMTEQFVYPYAQGYIGYISEDESKVLLYDFLMDPEKRWVYLLNEEGEVEREWVLPYGEVLGVYGGNEEGFIMYEKLRMTEEAEENKESHYIFWKFPYDGGEAEVLLELTVQGW